MRNVIKRFSAFIVAAAAILFLQCASAGYDDGADGSGYAGSPYDTLNPERGWYIARGTNEVDPAEFADFKNAHVSIVMLEANLGAYKNKALDKAKLDEIDKAFSTARSNGLSVIFRAAYTFDEVPNPEPTNFSLILQHIDQLGPIFKANEDILFNVQAGFLGEWGEWHHSYYGDRNGKYSDGGPDNPPFTTYQRQVVNELLKVVPDGVTIALRRPEYIRNVADDSIVDSTLSPTKWVFGVHDPVGPLEAFGSSKIARLAFHNDALMSDETDMDTYFNDLNPQSKEKVLDWISRQTRYTPMVAETNLVSKNNDTEIAIPLLDRINIQALNIEYHPRVLRKWKTTDHDGMNAFDYIGMMIGYRFVLNRADLNELADSKLRLDLGLVNAGFGHLLKEKKFEIVLKNESQTYRTTIAEDARFWNKNEPVNRSYLFQLPSGITPGSWDVYLALSSTFESLADTPAYSVRFSNKDIWDEVSGLNKIGTIKLSGAGGSGGGKEFVQITP